MQQTQTPPTIEQVKQLASRLSPQDLTLLIQELQEQLYTEEMMAIAESGFPEWSDPEEDIYNAEA